MRLDLLSAVHFDAVMDLFCRVFQEDAFFEKLLPDSSTRQADMRTYCSAPIACCLQGGTSLGVWEEEKLLGFILCFDYEEVRKQPDLMASTFGSDEPGSRFPRMNNLLRRIDTVGSGILYLLFIAVDAERQRNGLGEALLDTVLRRFPQMHVVGDISNPLTLGMYKKRNFTSEEIEPDYFFVHHDPASPFHTDAFGESVRLLVPETDFLTAAEIPFTVRKTCRFLPDAEISSSRGIPFFVRRPGGICPAVEIELTYPDLLRFQRLINPSQYDEEALGDSVLYWNIRPYETEPLLNDSLRGLIRKRQTEWSLIPDVFVSIPVHYRDIGLLRPVPDDLEASQLLGAMDFRTNCELGMLVDDASVDDYSGLKKRLKRIYLGKFQLQITEEPLIGQSNESTLYLGPPAWVDMFITVDTLSGCAVLTWYSLSTPFLISFLLDCISRRQLLIIHEGAKVNFFSFISSEFGLTKQGNPKSAIIIPREHTCLEPAQLASLLAAETIYEDGEAYGILNDQELLSAASAQESLGQYNRAFLYAYTTVMVQFSPDLRAGIQDRLREESISVFYMELLLMEEAAIHTANQAMIRLLADKTMEEPVVFLDQVSRIYDDYCKTTDFWSVQANYPSAQRSLDVLRKAFRIPEQLEMLQRSQNQLESVFRVKSERVDRQSSRKMDISLALISFLAVFSAWIDGHDYIGTWLPELGSDTVHLLQRLLFAVVLLIAVFAVTHLLGDWVRKFLRERIASFRSLKKRGKKE